MGALRLTGRAAATESATKPQVGRPRKAASAVSATGGLGRSPTMVALRAQPDPRRDLGFAALVAGLRGPLSRLHPNLEVVHRFGVFDHVLQIPNQSGFGYGARIRIGPERRRV